MLEITGSALRSIRFNDIPEDVEIVCRVSEVKPIEDLFTLAPPAFTILNKHSFVFVYIFPKPGVRYLENVVSKLVTSIRGGAEASKLEFDVRMKIVEDEETLIVRVGRILTPAERRSKVLEVLSKYSRLFESEFKRRLFATT